MDNTGQNNSLKTSLMNLFGGQQPGDTSVSGVSAAPSTPIDPTQPVTPPPAEPIMTPDLPPAPVLTPNDPTLPMPSLDQPAAPAPTDPVTPEPTPAVPEVTPTPSTPEPTITPSVPDSTPVAPEIIPNTPDVTPTPSTPAPDVVVPPVVEPAQPEVSKVSEVSQVSNGEIELPDDVKESILDKTLRRVAEIMTEEDMREFERVDREDESGNAGKYFLMTRVPHFEKILQEELQYAQQEHAQNQASA